MLKAVSLTLLAALPIGSLFVPLAAVSTSALPAPTEIASGICGLYNHDGYLVVDESGNLINMQDYCQRQHDRSASATRQFWQAFTATANPTVMEVAQKLGQEQVVAYGSMICPFLDQGGTLAELRQIQGDGDLPRDFEVIVTVAAINTYCPAHVAEIGR